MFDSKELSPDVFERLLTREHRSRQEAERLLVPNTWLVERLQMRPLNSVRELR
ncbi:MAG: hypothetical protein ACI9A1_000319 [Lentimonas sp.]|jgi:hypothetical protein